MMNSITVFSTASNRHVVDSYHAALESLKSENVMVKHIGLAHDLWHGDAGNAYRSYGYRVCNLPRISGVMTPWWHTEDVRQELRESLPSISDFVVRLIDEHAPDVFLLADDTGPLEVFLIQTFNERNIPVVLLEHGYGFALLQELKLAEQIKRSAKRALSSLRSRVRLRSRIKLWLSSERKAISGSISSLSGRALPEVKPFGHNGDYLICSLSELTKRILVRHGVSAKIIRDTGYPYFDKIVRIRESRAKTWNKSRRILVVSTGRGIFRRVELTEKFYNFVTDMCCVLQNDYQISLRLKPGEELSSFLNPGLLEKLEALNIEYDDNARPSYEAIQNYSLVMGEASTVPLESIILNIPTVLFRYVDPPRNRPYTLLSVLENTLGVLAIEDPREARCVVEQALSEQYIKKVSSRLKENERYLFHHLDGKAGYRVGQVIMEAINRQS